MNVLPQFFYGMVVIGSLSMVGDGGGWGGVGRALASVALRCRARAGLGPASRVNGEW